MKRKILNTKAELPCHIATRHAEELAGTAPGMKAGKKKKDQRGKTEEELL